MGARFAKQYPMLRKSDYEKKMFLFAVFATVSLALLLVIMLSTRGAGAKENMAPSPVEPMLGTVTLLAPEREVPSGAKLSSIELREVYWPRTQVPEGAVRDFAEVKAMYAKVSLQPGQPIVRSNLTDKPVRGSLPLTKGYRAVSIDVDATESIEGHALPGTRVDVVLTYMQEEQLTSKVIVQNTRVLSLGGSDKEIGERTAELLDSPVKANSTITLEVTPQDALEITTARQLGRLSLMMRAADDDLAPNTIELDQRDIEGGVRSSRSAKANTANCSRGRIRSAGKEFMIDCDGTISEVLEASEP